MNDDAKTTMQLIQEKCGTGIHAKDMKLTLAQIRGLATINKKEAA